MQYVLLLPSGLNLVIISGTKKKTYGKDVRGDLTRSMFRYLSVRRNFFTSDFRSVIIDGLHMYIRIHQMTAIKIIDNNYSH